jgi:hypothetical protein
MHFKRYVLTMEVTVTDPKALKKAARERARAEGLSAKHWKEMRSGANDDLVMLIDRGSDFDAGYEIELTDCDIVRELAA